MGKSIDGLTHSVRDISRGGENNGSDGSSKDKGASCPEAIHFKEHMPEVWTGKVPSAQCVSIFLTTSAVDCDDVFDKDVQSSGHGGPSWRGRDAEGSFIAAHPQDIEGEMNGAKVVHHRRQRHGQQADCQFVRIPFLELIANSANAYCKAL